MNLLMYLVGMAYYVAVPLSLALEAAPFDPHHSIGDHSIDVTIDTLSDPSLPRIVGWALFLWGNREQHRCHVVLAQLRGEPGSSLVALQSAYPLPTRGWFETVTSPHYTFEIIIYGAFVVLSGARWTVIGLWLWVVANLCVTADRTHAWYRHRFPEKIPPGRLRLLPGVF